MAQNVNDLCYEKKEQADGQFPAFYTMLCLKSHNFHERFQLNQFLNGTSYSADFPVSFPDCSKNWDMDQTFQSSETVDCMN